MVEARTLFALDGAAVLLSAARSDACLSCLDVLQADEHRPAVARVAVEADSAGLVRRAIDAVHYSVR